MPGKVARKAIMRWRNSSRLSLASGHCSRGFNNTMASEILGGITSVATSAVPVRAKIALISGNSFNSNFSVFSCIRKDCSKPVLGERICCTAKSPSLNCGANSLPTCVASTPVKNKIHKARVSTKALNSYAQFSNRVYCCLSQSIQRLSFSLISPVTHNATAAGTKLIERRMAPIRANTTVIAMG